MVAPEILELLDEFRTAEVPHTGRTLRAHLVRTHGLLEGWGNPEEVCLAGLFHSIYGTQTFRTQPAGLDRREHIRSRIGRRAEELAYLFGACDRDRMFTNVEKRGGYTVEDLVANQEISISEDTLKALMEIELANDLEQIPYRHPMSAGRRARWLERWRSARRFLSVKGYEALLGTSEPSVLPDGR